MVVDIRVDRASVLKALAEPARFRILALLADEELCVCHLVEALDMPQPLVSHHLKALRAAGLVQGERFRQWMYYRLCPEALRTVADGLAAMAERAPVVGDRRRPCC
jgi:ArsR family transcriptional regulator